MNAIIFLIALNGLFVMWSIVRHDQARKEYARTYNEWIEKQLEGEELDELIR